MRSTLEGSAQCKSSSNKTTGEEVAKIPNASPISRIIRSLVAPIVSCCNVSIAEVDAKATGNCEHQVGAEVRITAASRSRDFPSSKPPIATKNGNDAAPVTHSQTQRPRDTDKPGKRERARRRNSSDSDVLPMPGSPLINTTWPLPLIAC